MKKVLLFTAVVASLVMSCSKSADEIKLEEFKNSLDNPGSFEFVSWGNEYATIQVKHKDDIDNRKDKIHGLLETRSKNRIEKIEKGIPYNSIEETEIDFLYFDTAYSLINITRPIKVEKGLEDVSKRNFVLERVKLNKGYNDLNNVCDYMEAYLDTAAFDTLYKVKAFKYRATNKFGALELMDGEIELD